MKYCGWGKVLIPFFFFFPGESRQNCPKADIWDVSQPVLAVAINRLTGFSYLGMFDYRAGFKDILGRQLRPGLL